MLTEEVEVQAQQREMLEQLPYLLEVPGEPIQRLVAVAVAVREPGNPVMAETVQHPPELTVLPEVQELPEVMAELVGTVMPLAPTELLWVVVVVVLVATPIPVERAELARFQLPIPQVPILPHAPAISHKMRVRPHAVRL